MNEPGSIWAMAYLICVVIATGAGICMVGYLISDFVVPRVGPLRRWIEKITGSREW